MDRKNVDDLVKCLENIDRQIKTLKFTVSILVLWVMYLGSK